ncbi:VRR-NUC domain-containing protein [Halomonas sp. BM-2019]|uniref:VRR-NUC domain-containing protein n=1 Tax=Halomonas sp. BM-2019 TaxID=2811227 RepID=UPI001B3C2396|nr:MAG: VRR-NUC domain-containing protein [Halomonas sp. BM-2019]
MTSSSPTASLEDPFYYLANFQFVLGWVAERHGDLLSAEEQAFLADFAALPRASRALLVRMVMRRGEHFRTSKLVYPEISADSQDRAESGDGEVALAPLMAAGLVEGDPVLPLELLFAQLRLPELRLALAEEIRAAGLPAMLGKAALFDALAPRRLEARPLAEWWPAAPDRVVRLTVMASCDRLRLLFFGNLRQDWAEFVLTELGLQCFEVVPFGAESRAFQRRAELEAYLALHRLRQRLDAGESAVGLVREWSAPPDDNPWLRSRGHRLRVALGRQAEREGAPGVALDCYVAAGWPPATGSAEARVRRLRLLERQGRYAEALALAEPLARAPADEAEAQALERLLPRLRRRLGLPVEASPPASEPQWMELRLARTAGVELAVRDRLHRDEAPVHYVENALFTGLFGLLCCLATLDEGRHGEAILATWRAKQGIANPFVHWDGLDEPLLTLALARIPPAHLRACFERLLGDLKANRAGLPDLIQFLPEASAPTAPAYRLIEVKGPGDSLQDNQRRWLAFFRAEGIPAAVCRVRWQDGGA